MNLRSTSCCGLGEMSGISYHSNYSNKRGIPTPKDVLTSLCLATQRSDFYHKKTLRTKAFYIFTGVTRRAVYGERLATYILENKLGEISTIKARKNANSGNMIQVWTWGVNKTNLEKWWKANEKV